MADKEISELTAADPLDGDELLHVVQGGNSRRTTVGALQPEIIQADVRQTVNTGPVDSDGRADFLAAGTGLEVVTTGLTTTPLNLTMGDGFGPRGKRDLSFEVDSNLSWGPLPDDTDAIYLFLEWDGSTLSTGRRLRAPTYSLARPSSAPGQYWYPTDHRSRGEQWNGSEWVPVLRVYVGECATSGGSVASVTSYAYQGKAFIVHNSSVSANARVNISHNIGADNNLMVWFNRDADGFLGKRFLNTIGYASRPENPRGSHVVTNKNHSRLYTGESEAYRTTGSPENVNLSTIPAPIFFDVKRTF